jgi:YtkA-like
MRLGRRVTSLACCALSALGAVACGSSSDGPSTTGVDQAATTNCDGRGVAYVAGMQQTAQSGMSVTLSSADPAPPAIGNNSWQVRALDLAGAPITGASVDVSGYMPDHGHYLNIAVISSDLGDGSYTLSPIYLGMPTYWEITLTVTDSGGTASSVMFPFCVPDN